MKKRWPTSLYDIGEEPDPRFGFANGRTFLVWIRTALALLAAAIAVDAFGEALNQFRVVAVIALALLGMTISGSAYQRWMAGERGCATVTRSRHRGRAAHLAGGVTVVGR